MRTCITEFCTEYEYPAEAQELLLSVCDRIEQTEAIRGIFTRAAEEYEGNPHINYGAYLGSLKAACEKEKVSWESASLLFFICLTPGLARHYARSGLPGVLCRACLEDLKWKLKECRQVYGVWGSFVPDWFEGFFRLTRFTFGRLQFELLPFPGNYAGAGRGKPEADRVINIHIPSSGPLFHEECLRSYRLAADFFGDKFPGGECVFFCDSWLLYPRHREFLPADSRILQFMGDFEIYTFAEDPRGGDLWRIFGLADCSGYAKLPEKTSLQRSYKKWLLAGGKPGTGSGIFRIKK